MIGLFFFLEIHCEFISGQSADNALARAVCHCVHHARRKHGTWKLGVASNSFKYCSRGPSFLVMAIPSKTFLKRIKTSCAKVRSCRPSFLMCGMTWRDVQQQQALHFAHERFEGFYCFYHQFVVPFMVGGKPITASFGDDEHPRTSACRPDTIPAVDDVGNV